MITAAREALAQVSFASQLVKLAASLEVAVAARNGLARAAAELRRLAQESLKSSGQPSSRI